MKILYPLKGTIAFVLIIFLSLFFCAMGYGQGTSRIVTGTVTDQNNEPLAGVSVSARQSGQSTSTNSTGSYQISVVGTGETLRFTYIGFTPKEVLVGGNSTLKVLLTPDTKVLRDVVVIGYGTSSRKDVTGAITSVKADEFNRGVYTTPAELLQGKVAGLNVTKSGDPNQPPATILRGPSTLREGAAQEPFYVIDGVPGASIDLLAPADIESIDVLKDAASTSIYGSRAANGVIIVTTRKSKAGQSRLTYSSYISTQKVSKRINVLTGDELRTYLKANGQTLKPGIDDDGSNTNWQNLVEQQSYSHNQNVSYGGASDHTEYGASVNYLKNNGVIRHTSLERTIARGYLNQRFFNDRLRLGLTLTNSSTNSTDVRQDYILPGMLFYLPTVSPFNPDRTYKENYTRTGSGPLNPLSLLNNNSLQGTDNKTLINAQAQVDILPGLKYTLSGSTQRDQANSNFYLNSQSGLAVGANGVARRSSYLNTTRIVESYANYDRVFGKHTIKLLLGYSYQEDRVNDGFGVQTQGFTNDNLTFNNLFLSNPTALSLILFDNKPISTLRLVSYYGRVGYQYGDKYLFQASLRNDGSSAFGVNHRFGYFPSISGAWRIISEPFMQNAPGFSDLKLRVGYGVSGNSLGFDAFSALLIYGTPPGNSKFLSNGNITNAIGPVRNDNPNLKWENTGTVNIGLDFGFFHDRLTGSADYYIKKTSDLIYNQYPVSTTQYFTNFYTANVGRIKNTGIELVLNGVIARTNAFKWTSSINFSNNKNVVETLSNSQFTLNYIQTAQLGGKGQSGNYSQRVEPGRPLGTFYLWHYLGKNNKGVSTYQKADGTTTATQPLTTDQRTAGSAQPKLIYGWTNTFVYKNFDLNFLIRGVYGNKILNATLATLNNPADAKLQNIPRFTLGESFNDINGYLISDRFLENGSYLRLDNATLGYTIRPHLRDIKGLRVFITGNNLWVLTKYRGIDPEINIGGLTPGIDNQNYYPKTRTFSLGLTASF